MIIYETSIFRLLLTTNDRFHHLQNIAGSEMKKKLVLSTK